MAADRITGKSFGTRSEIIATNGMVATSQPLATQVGLDILKQGGTAADAAIAVNACLGLMEPTGCGIGGDMFAVYWDAKTKKLYGLNASGPGPSTIDLDELKSHLNNLGLDSIPLYGPLSVNVPGTVAGWYKLHDRFGKLPMSTLLNPAIEYAENGFPVSELISYFWRSTVKARSSNPDFLNTFSVNGKRGPLKGEIWKNLPLAETYRIIINEGKDGFYKGELAKKMTSFLASEGSYLRYEDFANYDAEWVEPVSTNYRGYDVWELPPNGQGIAALQILNLLEGYDLSNFGFGSLEHIHLLVEAKKIAFADRAHFCADLKFVDVPVTELISKSYADERRKLIDENRAALKVSHGPEKFVKGDTVCFAIADGEGNMVSFIQSNFYGMGSGVCPPKMGFGFQNRGTSFSLDPKHANVFAPGKRPFHTIIPTFVTKDNKPYISFGVMGGATQPQAHAQIIMNIVDFGMNLQEAGDAPRILHTGSSEPTGLEMIDGGYVSLENGFDQNVIRDLQIMGHDIRAELYGFGGYQAVMIDLNNGVFYGASESRKDGQAAGY